MKATIVYQNIWNAINETAPDGGRKYRYFILEGSSRSSKTRSLLQIFYTYAYSNEKARLSVWRDVAKDCRDTVGHDMEMVYPDLEGFNDIKYHSTKSIYTFPTKCTIEITGTDDTNKVHGYQGDVIWLNEPYKISKDTFDQLDMRTTDIVVIDWNPKQAHFIDDLKKDPRTIVLHSTFKDNPFCPPEQRKKILSYQTIGQSDVVISGLMRDVEARDYDVISNRLRLTERQIKELIRCRENEFKGSANAFNWDVYGLGIKAEKPNRIFHWKEISIDAYHAINAKIYTGIDWGTVDPWGIVDAKYYDGCLHLREINYLSENNLRARLNDTELTQIQNSEDGFVVWYFNRFGIPKDREMICDTNRPLKIAGLRKVGWTKALPAANKSILDGIDILSQLKIYFTSDSVNLKYEQENYSRVVDKYGIVQEEPEDANNHLIDPTRYIALQLKRLGIIRNV